ncbi:helix-turn-helix domain-containing protein [Tabrizicola aquatica]|uniref:helix-turn-helix domain-containing protein n=1 Tax=Tabrizicola aquatica TaxID=909926 RepID=UPI000CD05F25|nr:helix-turn-helix domain-containing protein [Tabrizicola aquatica]
MNTEQPIFLTLQEARGILRCGRSKIYELLASGELRASKLHGKTLIARAELDRFIATLIPTDVAA